MPLDWRIIAGIESPKIDSPAESISKAAEAGTRVMRMRQLGQGMADERAMREAATKHTAINPRTGKPEVDWQSFSADAAKIDPVQGMGFDLKRIEREERTLNQQRKAIDYGLQLLSSAEDQPSWERAKTLATGSGFDAKNIPDVYDPSYKKFALSALIDAKAKRDQEWKAKDFELKKARAGLSGRAKGGAEAGASVEPPDVPDEPPQSGGTAPVRAPAAPPIGAQQPPAPGGVGTMADYRKYRPLAKSGQGLQMFRREDGTIGIFPGTPLAAEEERKAREEKAKASKDEDLAFRPVKGRPDYVWDDEGRQSLVEGSKTHDDLVQKLAADRTALDYAKNNLAKLRDLALRIKSNKALDSVVGPLDSNLPTVRAKSKTFESDLDTLMSDVMLNAITSLKSAGGTMGALSESEGRVLQNSVESLDLGQDETSFRRKLQGIADHADNLMKIGDSGLERRIASMPKVVRIRSAADEEAASADKVISADRVAAYARAKGMSFADAEALFRANKFTISR